MIKFQISESVLCECYRKTLSIFGAILSMAIFCNGARADGPSANAWHPVQTSDVLSPDTKWAEIPGNCVTWSTA